MGFRKKNKVIKMKNVTLLISVLLSIFFSLVLVGGVMVYVDHKILKKMDSSLPIKKRKNVTKLTSVPSKISTESDDKIEKIEKIALEKTQAVFTKELPSYIVNKVTGLKGYYSYYLHDLSEEKGESGSNKKMLSASTIKLFILEAAFSQVKEDGFLLDSTYILSEEDKVPGTGDIQNSEEGTRYTNEELLTKMISDSDNTATNIIIDRLGGLEKINIYISSNGYDETVLSRKMGDTVAISEGRDNYTSVDDVGRLMSKLAKKELIGKEEDEKMLDILSKGKNHNKLAKHLPDNLTIYCKSGEYSDFGVQNDTILMEGPEGDYILTIMSEGGDESEQFSVMQDIGKEAYDLISKK